MPYFIEFLKTAGLFDDWVADCSLDYRSPNPPTKRDVLGTLLLSLLAGHRRFAHNSSVRGDGVNPQFLTDKSRPSNEVTITSLHARARKMKEASQRASAFLQWVRATAEQLTRAQRWRLILSWIFRQFPHGRVLGTPAYVTHAPSYLPFLG